MSSVSDRPETIGLVPLTPAMLGPAHLLSHAVAWPHRLQDWQFALSLGHGIAAFERDRLVGTAMWWPFEPDFATLGMVIVAPDRQGVGLGRRLMQAVIEAAGPRAIGLNATSAGLPLYEKLGFVRVGEIHQHQGRVTVPAPVTAPVRPAAESDWLAIEALDRAACGLDRRALLAALRSLGRGNVLLREGKVAGFSLVREFGRGQSIGPVVAPDVQGAKALIADWAGQSLGSFLRVDCPGDSGLGDWLAGLGLAPVAPVASMVHGVPPRPGTAARLFGLVSQALG